MDHLSFLITYRISLESRREISDISSVHIGLLNCYDDLLQR